MTSGPNLLPADLVEWLRRWMRDRCGVSIRDDQEYLVLGRLAPLARDAGVSLEELLSRLRAGDTRLGQAVVDALTTNETSWFRDVHTFDALAADVLPRLLHAREEDRELSVWSAASSSGQELYSLAMLLDDRFAADLAGWRVNLVGSDVSSAMIARARSGRYSQLEVDRGLPARYLVRYFEAEGISWVVRPEIRRMAAFSELNLVSDAPPGVFDVILCRYVLIYFDEETRQRVVDSLVRGLRPGGVLVLGAGEIGGKSVSGLRPELHNKGVFYVRD